MSPRLTCALLLVAAPLAAQGDSWGIPARGAAVYERDLVVESRVEPDGARVGFPWAGRQGPGLVLWGELDEDRQRIAEPLADLRDLLALPAMDLSIDRARRVEQSLPRRGNLYPDSTIELSFGDVDDAGRQTFEGRVTFRREQRGDRRRDGGRKSGRRRRGAGAPGPAPRSHVTAELRGERTVDRERGLVTDLDGTAELRYFVPGKDGGPDEVRTITLRDQWRLQHVITPADPEFRVGVGRAIRSSVEWLEKTLRRRIAQKPPEPSDPFHDHNPGELALLLLAIVKGTDDPQDELVQQGYAALRERKIFGTYELAVAVLAIEALYTPPGEFRALREGRIDAPLARRLSDEDLELVGRWTAQLLENIDQTVDPAYVRRWHYGPSTRWDNSNTQYALLGLYAAQLCGVEISPQVWHAASRHWLDVQIVEGEPGRPALVRRAQREQLDAGRRVTTVRGRKLQPAGWAYQGSGEPTGSMTTAGLTGLTLCQLGLRDARRGTRKEHSEIEQAIRAGFLWMQDNLSVRRNPGPGGVWGSWVYYYLYGLERTCELNGIALLGDRDWYFDGAMVLLGQQRPDGSWGDLRDTCFGLLFLKKAALPAITQR